MLPRNVYIQLVKCLTLPVGAHPHFKLILKRYPGIRQATLYSIFSQENQYRVIKYHHIHKHNIPYYWSRYLAGEDILEISADVDFPPCLLVRRMLEQMLRLSKQDVSAVLKNPAALPAAAAKTGDKMPAEFILRLQDDLVRCARADVAYSPFSDMARQIAGQEHELLLYSQLQRLGVPFWSEAQLRSQGLHKTPDVRLQVPIAVLDQQAGCYRVVNWIDSKATFGDERTHQQQLEGQYRNYVNRYGPGLVIYWFGYLADLATDHEVLIMERCPAAEQLRQLPRLELPAGEGQEAVGGGAGDGQAPA